MYRESKGIDREQGVMQSALAVAAWLTARGGSISDQIAPCVDASMGVGLCATAPLPAPTRRAGFELLRMECQNCTVP